MSVINHNWNNEEAPKHPFFKIKTKHSNAHCWFSLLLNLRPFWILLKKMGGREKKKWRRPSIVFSRNFVRHRTIFIGAFYCYLNEFISEQRRGSSLIIELKNLGRNRIPWKKTSNINDYTIGLAVDLLSAVDSNPAQDN